MTLILLFVLGACGGAPPPDEVTESWTSGDDEAVGAGEDRASASDPPR